MRDPQNPSSSASDKVSVGEAMRRDVMCVTETMSTRELASLMLERNVSHAPVVDAEGRVVGMVSMSDLARASWARGPRAISATVADVMMPFAFTLGENASLARAAALMAYEGVGRIVIVEPGGKVGGVLGAVDVMRWLAREAGYVVPGYTRGDRDEVGAVEGRSVLVVDDDADMREQLAEVLGDEGYEVVTAGNGVEALARLREARPALILLDLAMPVMDGWAFQAELRKDRAFVDIPIVLLSGQGNARESAARLDARACLVKPVPYPTLIGTVQRFCA